MHEGCQHLEAWVRGRLSELTNAILGEVAVRGRKMDRETEMRATRRYTMEQRQRIEKCLKAETTKMTPTHVHHSRATASSHWERPISRFQMASTIIVMTVECSSLW